MKKIKQIIKAINTYARHLDLTDGKKYEVVSKGLDDTCLNGKYYEVYDDKNILMKYDASFFENWENDIFDNERVLIQEPICSLNSNDESIMYCTSCNKKFEFGIQTKCINDGLIHNVISMKKSEYEKRTQSDVNHPQHYGGAENIYEAIKVIEAWRLGFCLGNAIKYIARAGKKDEQKYIEDLEKAAWYLNRKIESLKKEKQ